MNEMLVIADDISGAAECAGAGWRRGFDVELRTDSPAETVAGFTVMDTDSRLLPPAQAAAKVQALIAGRPLRPGGVFKKTDSVLRGPVRAELQVFARALGRRLCLLAPANPLQGRTVERGRLHVRGVPLDQTEFARDPHHPAHSADARRLLGWDASFPVSVLSLGDPWPESGICVGDARTDEDLRAWAARARADEIPIAGSAGFLSAVLAHLGRGERTLDEEPPARPSPRTLICSGSASAASHDRIRLAETGGLPVHWLPSDPSRTGAGAQERREVVTAAFARSATAILGVAGPLSREPGVPERLLEALVGIALEILSVHRVDRLLLEGGATAACLLRGLGMDRFRVLREWAPGVVTLRATDGRGPEITIKPGSYPWLGPFAEALS